MSLLSWDVNNTNVIDNMTVESVNVLPLGPSDEEGIQKDTHSYSYSCRPALSIDGVSLLYRMCGQAF